MPVHHEAVYSLLFVDNLGAQLACLLLHGSSGVLVGHAHEVLAEKAALAISHYIS